LYGAFFVKRWLYHIVHFLPQLLRRRCPSTGRRRSITKIRRRRPVEGQRKTVQGEPARSGDDRRHNLVFGGALCGLRTMMQSYASAARLLGGRAHSLPRHCSHGWLRVTARLGLSWHCITPINAKPVFDGLLWLAVSTRSTHVAGRNTAPAGTSPVVTKRHKAISSLRARATIMVLRTPALAPSVRAWNHWVKALSFWNKSQRHAS
jgi:hypothetical protein